MITHDDADNNTAEEWEPTVLDHKISKGLAGMPLRSIIFSFVYNDSAVTDQVLDMLSNLHFSEYGLREIIFEEWLGLDQALTPVIIESFASKIKKLSVLKAYKMNHLLSDEAKDSLAELISQIITNASGLTRVALSYNRFSP